MRRAEQLTRALDDDGADRRARETLADVRRRAGWDLGDHRVRCRVDHAQDVGSGRRDMEIFAVVAELRIARRLVERDAAHDRARRQINDDERELPRLLRRDVGDAVGAVDADQDRPAVGQQRDAVRLGPTSTV